MTTATATKWDVYSVSNLYDAGYNEDGEMIEGLRFQVQATAPDGTRFMHSHYFNSTGVNQLDRVKAAVEALVNRIRTAQKAGKWAGPTNGANWYSVDPAYGSPAYSANWRFYEANRKHL